MGSEPPAQSPPQEVDSHYWVRSGDRCTGLALRRLAGEAVRTLSLWNSWRAFKGGLGERELSLQVVEPLSIGIEAG